jgi:hypothetical protein
VHVLDVLGTDDRHRPRRELLREHRGDDVRLVAGGAGDQELGVLYAGRLKRVPAGAVADHRRHVVAVRERAEPFRVEIDDDELMLSVERLDDGRADSPGSDDEDPHRVRG